MCDQSGNTDRDVICEDEYNRVVEDYFCNGLPKPPNTETCIIQTDGDRCSNNDGLDAVCRDGRCDSIDPCE